MTFYLSSVFYKAIDTQKSPAQNPGKQAKTLFLKMSRRKLDKSKWREGHRRSPRISALEACKACRPRLVTSTTRTGATATGSASSQKMKRHLGNDQGQAFSTRARKKRKIRPAQEVATTKSSLSPPNQDRVQTSHEDHKTKSGQLVLQGQNGLQPKVDVAAADQPPAVPSAPGLPEKRILELILDILQRRDTHEIFAQPVDPNEVEDYYEIIDEPMDFGTMRAKLHEGMYTSLEQFEHDVFLITENAMHFNSSATVFFRQARALQELSKKVFHVLKTYPENFELEFSEARQRSGRRAHGEAGKSASSSCPRISTHMKSSKAMSCSLLSGSPNIRRCQVLSGTQDGIRSRSFESDQRGTYRPWTSFLNENESIGLTLSSNLQQLEHVNQQDIGYTESLMFFVKDLGPTAQKIARKKLRGPFQFQKSKIPSASTSTQWPPSTQSNVFTSPPSQNFQDNLHWHPTSTKSSGDRLHSCHADKEEKGSLRNEVRIENATLEVASSGDGKSSHGTFGGKVHFSEFHQNRRNEIQLDSYSLKAHHGDNTHSVSGFKNIGSNSTPLILNQWKSANQSQSLESPSEYSWSNLLDPRLKNMGFSSFSEAKNKLSSLHLRGGHDQTKAAQGPSHEISISPDRNQVPKDSKPDQTKPLPRQFTFDLPYLRSQLSRINSSGQDRFLQKGSGADLMCHDKQSYQKASTCNHPVELRNQPYDDYQNKPSNRPSIDTQYPDLALQL